MAIQIDIPDDDVRFLNPPAQTQLREHVDEYIDKLLAEASRIEAAQKTTAGDPEINSTMIKDAAHLIKRGYQQHRKSGMSVFLDIAGSVSALLVGLVFDFDRLKDPVLLVGFVILLAVSLGINIFTIMKD